jgi:hypothetical protein
MPPKATPANPSTKNINPPLFQSGFGGTQPSNGGTITLKNPIQQQADQAAAWKATLSEQAKYKNHEPSNHFSTDGGAAAGLGDGFVAGMNNKSEGKK